MSSTMFPETQTATGSTSSSPANGAAEVEVQAVDLNEEQTVENQDADFNVVPSPPPAKRYPTKISLHEDGIDARRGKAGTFLNVPLVLTIADGGQYDGYSTRAWINNIYNKLKGTTKVHWILKCLGVTVPKTIKMQDLKELLEQTLNQNPVMMVDWEWEASIKDSNDRRANEAGYVKLKNRMSQFDRNPDGTYSNIFKSPMDGSDVYARASIPEDAFHAK